VQWGSPRKSAINCADWAENEKLQENICICIFPIFQRGSHMETFSHAYYEICKVLYKSIFTKVVKRFILIEDKHFPPKTVANITLKGVLGKSRSNI
jgi:hypothetical protein